MLPTLAVSPRLAPKADKFEQAMAFFVPGDREHSRVNTEGSSIIILTLISRSHAIAVLLSVVVVVVLILQPARLRRNYLADFIPFSICLFTKGLTCPPPSSPILACDPQNT